MTPKPDGERCTVFVVPVGWRASDGYRCKLTATATREGHLVCHRRAATLMPVMYVDEPEAAGRMILFDGGR